MSKVLVSYFSKYGTTKKYAEWIASELDADICSGKDLKPETLANYDTIVIGSGLYAGTIKAADVFVRNQKLVKGKKLVLFTCGSADYSLAENINEIGKRIENRLVQQPGWWSNNSNEVPEHIRRDIKVFCLRGGVDYKRLSFPHRMMMGFVNKMLKKKKPDELNNMEKGFMDSYKKTVDYTDRNTIGGIIDYCGKTK